MRQADRREDTNFDCIWKWHYENVEIVLTPEQEKLKNRWDNMWKLLGGFLTPAKVIRKHLRDFPEISDRTAWNDMKNAKALFGDPAVQNRSARREIANVRLERAMKKTEEKGEWGPHMRAHEIYAKINQLDKADESRLEDLLEHFKPHTFVLSDKTQEELQQEADELMNDVPAVDADFTVVGDDESEAG